MEIKTFTAVIEDHNGFDLYTGTGKTRQEAIDAIMATVSCQIRIYVDREDGISLSEQEIEKAPTETPDNCVLVVMERCSHGSGYPYDRRYIAVPKGGVIRYPNGKELVIEKALTISFLDSNSDYSYSLPPGSSQYVESVWQPIQKVEYNY